MIVTIHESRPKARKDYYCNACEFLFEDDISGLTFSEYRTVVRAKWNGKKILKGQTYIRQFNGDETIGDTWTYRAIPEIHKICVKYKLYDNY